MWDVCVCVCVRVVWFYLCGFGIWTFGWLLITAVAISGPGPLPAVSSPAADRFYLLNGPTFDSPENLQPLLLFDVRQICQKMFDICLLRKMGRGLFRRCGGLGARGWLHGRKGDAFL